MLIDVKNVKKSVSLLDGEVTLKSLREFGNTFSLIRIWPSMN